MQIIFVIVACAISLLKAACLQPLNHQEVVDFRVTNHNQIQVAKGQSVYDAIGIVELCSQELNNKGSTAICPAKNRLEYFSRLSLAVGLGIGFRYGIIKTAAMNENEKKSFKGMAQALGNQLDGNVDLINLADGAHEMTHFNAFGDAINAGSLKGKSTIDLKNAETCKSDTVQRTRSAIEYAAIIDIANLSQHLEQEKNSGKALAGVQKLAKEIGSYSYTKANCIDSELMLSAIRTVESITTLCADLDGFIYSFYPRTMLSWGRKRINIPGLYVDKNINVYCQNEQDYMSKIMTITEVYRQSIYAEGYDNDDSSDEFEIQELQEKIAESKNLLINALASCTDKPSMIEAIEKLFNGLPENYSYGNDCCVLYNLKNMLYNYKKSRFAQSVKISLSNMANKLDDAYLIDLRKKLDVINHLKSLVVYKLRLKDKEKWEETAKFYKNYFYKSDNAPDGVCQIRAMKIVKPNLSLEDVLQKIIDALPHNKLLTLELLGRFMFFPAMGYSCRFGEDNLDSERCKSVLKFFHLKLGGNCFLDPFNLTKLRDSDIDGFMDSYHFNWLLLHKKFEDHKTTIIESLTFILKAILDGVHASGSDTLCEAKLGNGNDFKFRREILTGLLDFVHTKHFVSRPIETVQYSDTSKLDLKKLQELRQRYTNYYFSSSSHATFLIPKNTGDNDLFPLLSWINARQHSELKGQGKQ